MEQQVKRLEESGYSKDKITSFAKSILLQERKGKREREKMESYVVIPYKHNISHRIRKIMRRKGVEVFFNYPWRLNKIPIMVEKEKVKCSRKEVKKVECAKGVVYSIPLTCGKIYTGQTGKCLNERLAEHENTIRREVSRSQKNESQKEKSDTTTENNLKNLRLVEHLNKCEGCVAVFEKTEVRGKHKSREAREVLEGFLIEKENKIAVSETSVVVTNEEAILLEDRAKKRVTSRNHRQRFVDQDQRINQRCFVKEYEAKKVKQNKS